MKLPSLSIFFPTLNDAPVLPELVAKANDAAKKVAKRYEIIMINDGSTDNTREVLTSLVKKYKNLRAIHHRKPSGYGGALASGFAAAKYNWVFYTDGDGQYDPVELTQMVKQLQSGVDVVNGYKIRRADPLLRRLLGSLYNWLTHRLYPLPIRDLDCDFRLIRRSLMKNIRLTNQSAVVCLELVTKLSAEGALFAEVPVHHYPRAHGQSAFFQFGNLYKTLKELLNSTGYGS